MMSLAGCANVDWPPQPDGIDHRSYMLGILGGFSEIVRLGVMELALSEVMTPSEMDHVMCDAWIIADRNEGEENLSRSRGSVHQGWSRNPTSQRIAGLEWRASECCGVKWQLPWWKQMRTACAVCTLAVSEPNAILGNRFRRYSVPGDR